MTMHSQFLEKGWKFSTTVSIAESDLTLRVWEVGGQKIKPASWSKSDFLSLFFLHQGALCHLSHSGSRSAVGAADGGLGLWTPVSFLLGTLHNLSIIDFVVMVVV